MSWVRRTMIVPDANVALARQLTATIAGSSGSNMWNTGLSATGTGVPTHWISAGLIQDNFAAMMTDATATHNAALAYGMNVTLTDIQALISGSAIVDEEPFTVMANLGLQLIQSALG